MSRKVKQPYKGFFIPQNPKKYFGDTTKIIYRSGLELRAMHWFDTKSAVIKWSSELTIVPYIHPSDGKYHRYFVDFKVTFKQADGTEKTFLVEVKPKSQVNPPVKSKKPTTKNKMKYEADCRLFLVNHSKWESAEKLCKNRGWEWMILTEDTLTYQS